MKRPILAAAFIAFALPAAQGEAEVYLEPPRLPPSAYWGEEVESEVTIVESECRRARDAKRDIPVPLSPCARATTCTCRGRPAPGPRLRHFGQPLAPTPTADYPPRASRFALPWRAATEEETIYEYRGCGRL